jgi:hypothetical protein
MRSSSKSQPLEETMQRTTTPKIARLVALASAAVTLAAANGHFYSDQRLKRPGGG